jgi:hypothetical protein
MARTTWTNQISTAIPADISTEDILRILHNHVTLITMSPIVTRHEENQREGEKVTYDVWEHINVLPFGLAKREIQFSTAFQNVVDGIVTWIEAPMGLTSQATYAVKSMTGADGQPEQRVLEESIESSCNGMLKSFVESTMVSTRKKMHTRILEKARQEQSVEQRPVE